MAPWVRAAPPPQFEHGSGAEARWKCAAEAGVNDPTTGGMVLWVCAALPPRCEHGRDADDDADGDADDDECDDDEDEDHADDDEDDGPPGICVRAARRLRCYVGGSGRFFPLCMH